MIFTFASPPTWVGTLCFQAKHISYIYTYIYIYTCIHTYTLGRRCRCCSSRSCSWPASCTCSCRCARIGLPINVFFAFGVAVCVAVTFGQEMDLVEKQLLEMLMDTKLQSFLQLCACRSSVCCLFSILYQKWSTY